MKKISILLMVVGLALSCSSSDDSKPEGETNDIPFAEGKIEMDVTMPNNPLVALYAQIDWEAGDIEAQVGALIAGLSAAEKQAVAAFEQEMEKPANMAYKIAMPFHALFGKDIYVKGNTQATTKYGTMVYNGEIRYDTGASSGQMYLENRLNTDSKLSVQYSREDIDDDILPQLYLSAEDFDVVHTNETAVVAGYTCTKHTYTSKSGASQQMKVEAWTSRHIPRAVNYVHPYFLDEEHGIVKMAIYHTPDVNYPVIYEFAKLDARAVSDTEIAIQQSSPLYNLPDDETTVALKMFEMLFVGGTP